MKVNYYEVLGVERSATEQQIRDRFRKLARENHPDRYKGPDKADAERRFQTLTEAVNILTNPTRRKQHDVEMAVVSKGGAIDFVQISKAYMAKGVKAYKENDFRGAYENFDLAAKHNEKDAKAWYHVALAAARIPSMMRQAVQAIETAAQLEPVNPTYLRDAGKISKAAGLSAKAERYFEQALQWDPQSVELQSALAELRAGKGEAGKGFTLFKKG
jgi:curved DNA-binding protein CbpA